ncbi:hypothetical protein CRENBAI_015231 [Crenichthys baileyi]|uniref:Uncharacterized protein n=1 Tax=Crenichthys baileyi TaxID=28760 RepID=A0AAV9RJL1_9TELE
MSKQKAYADPGRRRRLDAGGGAPCAPRASLTCRVLYLYNLWDQLISHTTLLSYFFRSCPLLLHTMAAFSWHYVNDIRNGAKQDRNVICEDVSFHLTFSCCLYRHFASEF